MKRKNMAILFGGCSPEYGVSLQSAHSVIQQIDTDKFRPILIGISSKGNWYRFDGDPEKIASDTWCNPSDCLPAAVSPDREAHILLVFHPGEVEKLPIDAAFPVLHADALHQLRPSVCEKDVRVLQQVLELPVALLALVIDPAGAHADIGGIVGRIIFIFVGLPHVENVGAMLGEFTLEMLYALKLRSVGKNRNKYGSLGGIAGTLFVKSREMSEEMSGAMGEADLLVTKPGGITVFEAIASELPLLVFRPFLGQEKRNSEFILGNGMGAVLPADPEQWVPEIRAALGDELFLGSAGDHMRVFKSLLDEDALQRLLRQYERQCA